MKIPTLFLACLLLPLLSIKLNAQSKEYVKGYMITLENDTINGFIKDDNRTVLAYQFLFKETLDSPAKTIIPTESNGFYFTPSFYYESIQINSVRDKQEKQFIRKLVDGNTDLYQVVKGKFYEYVLIKENGEQLQIAKNDTEEEGKYTEDTRYFGELKYFFRDCGDITANTKAIKYNEKTIVKLVQKYNSCKAPNTNNQLLAKGRKLKVKVGLTTGFRRYNLDVSDLQPPFRPYEGRGASLRFGGLVSFAYFRKLSLQTGVIYNSYTAEGEYYYLPGQGLLSHDISNLDIPILVKYNFSTKRTAPYFIGGIHLGKLLNGTSSEMRIRDGDILIDEEHELTLNNIVTYAAGFGVSIQLGKSTELNLDVMYNRTIMHLKILPDTTVNGMVLSSSIFF